MVGGYFFLLIIDRINAVKLMIILNRRNNDSYVTIKPPLPFHSEK